MTAAFPAKFTPQNYGRSPNWIIRQALNSLCHKRNLDQMAVVQFFESYVNSHRDTKASPQPIPKEVFFPYPTHWKQYSSDRHVIVNRRVARLVLQTYRHYGQDCQSAIEPILSDLAACLLD